VGPDELAALLTAEGRALVDSLTPYDEAGALAAGESARRRGHPADRVAAAQSQARLRTRARLRFGPGADRLWWSADTLEQATRPAVAARRAARFAAALPPGSLVADLGCGAGSDTWALAAAGLRVLAVDHDPLAAGLAAANAVERGLGDRVEVRCGDVRDVDLSSVDAWFADPARRAGGRRVLDPEGWSPPWSWVVAAAAAAPAGMAKVAPGIDHAAIPSGATAEWVSEGGDLLEACVAWGPLADPVVRRRAVLLPGEHVLDDSGGVPEPPLGPPGAYLLEPGPAVIRAGLVSVVAAELDGWLLDPRIAYIAADAAGATPFATRYEVLGEAPFGLKPLRAHLRGLGYGDVVVKKRGVAVDPEELRRRLRLGGGSPTATLVLTRTDAGPLALLVRPG
jgi:SAM-dependent methyltransferase